MLISVRLPWLQAAVMLAGVTPGYLAPDGSCASGATRLSAMVRLGSDRRAGSLEAGWSFTSARPSFSPRAEIPTRTIVRVELSRDFERLSCPPLSLVVNGEKDISRECSGIRTESARCGSTVCVSFSAMELTTGLSLSDLDGVRALGALSLKPSPLLRILVEVRGNGLAAASPAGSTTVKVSFERGGQRAAVQAGFVDCPLTSRNERIADSFRLSLSCSVHREW